jgi:heat shock protein HslJ
MKKIVFGSIILLLALTAAGCSSTNSAALPGTDWQVATLGGTPAIAGADPTLSFATDGTVSGWDGCNRFGGTYKESGSSLTITLGPSTLMACPEAIMTQASTFTKGLGDTASYRMDKANLTLKNASGADIMELAVVVPASLTGGTWQATLLNNGKEAVTGVVEGSTITAIFGTDGSLTGNGGCNNYNTTYKTDGNKITIAPAASTMMACAEDVSSQEANYFNALTKATTYSISNGELELRDDSGALWVAYLLK